jgi:hypothetical protein
MTLNRSRLDSLSIRLRDRGASLGVATLDLTDYEQETAARACRTLAHVERESAEKISAPAL